MLIYPVLGGGSGCLGTVWGLLVAIQDCPDIIQILGWQVGLNSLNFFVSFYVYRSQLKEEKKRISSELGY